MSEDRCCCKCAHAYGTDNYCGHACEGQLGCKQEGCQPCRAFDAYKETGNDECYHLHTNRGE